MAKQIRVLIIEDSEDDTLLLIRELRKGGYEPEYERVDTPLEMDKAIENNRFDIVISDYVMPHFSGLEALKLLKKKDIDIPFILVSGRIGEDSAVDAMKAGAQDYIRKDDLRRLIPAIDRELVEAEVRAKSKIAREALRRSENELNESQRVAKVGSWQWELGPDIITWSREYYHIVGRDLSLPPPKYEEHLRMYTEESAARLESVVKEALKNGTPYELDLELLHPDGSYRYMTARGEAVRNQEGKVVMLRGTLQDITERRKSEEELRKYRDHLEELVKERTAELEKKNAKLEHFNRLFVGRELRMAELKKIIADLEKEVAELKQSAE